MDDAQLIREALSRQTLPARWAKALQDSVDNLQERYDPIYRTLGKKGGFLSRSGLPKSVLELIQGYRGSPNLVSAIHKDLSAINSSRDARNALKQSNLDEFAKALSQLLALAQQINYESESRPPAVPSRDSTQSTAKASPKPVPEPPLTSNPPAIPQLVETATTIELFQRGLATARSQLGDVTKEVDTLLRKMERDTADALRQAQDERRTLATQVQDLTDTLSNRAQQHDVFVKAMRTDIIQLLDSAFPLWNATLKERQSTTDIHRHLQPDRQGSGLDFISVSANALVEHLLAILRDHFDLTRIVVSKRDKFDSATMMIVQAEPTEDPYYDQCVAREVKWGYRTASGATFRPAEVIVFKLRSEK